MSAFNNIAGELEKQGVALSMIEISSVRSWINRDGERACRSFFSPHELSCMKSMRISKRRLDFLSGRIAGKYAVRRLMDADRYTGLGKEDKDLRFANIDIRRTRTGAPRVFLCNSPGCVRVSITHSPLFAASAVCGMGDYRGIGIDLEKIDHRDESLLAVAFRESEIRAIGERAEKNGGSIDEPVTRFWSMKEAALKSMGIGLNVDLKDIGIVEEAGDGVRLVFENEARKRFSELGAHRIEVKGYTVNNHVLSVAFLH
jgi:phosphopantetheine--protein transferase-like protein